MSNGQQREVSFHFTVKIVLIPFSIQMFRYEPRHLAIKTRWRQSVFNESASHFR